jgi:hypothetical protein
MGLLPAGCQPGGCLCLSGDCPHCLVTVDGIAYVRSCQVAGAAAGWWWRGSRSVSATGPAARGSGERRRRGHPAYVFAEVVVIGQGEGGPGGPRRRRARPGGRSVTLEARQGEEVDRESTRGRWWSRGRRRGCGRSIVRSLPGRPPPESRRRHRRGGDTSRSRRGIELAGIVTRFGRPGSCWPPSVAGGRLVTGRRGSPGGGPRGDSGRRPASLGVAIAGALVCASRAKDGGARGRRRGMAEGTEERVACDTVSSRARDGSRGTLLARLGRGVSESIRVVGRAGRARPADVAGRAGRRAWSATVPE